MQRHDNSVVLRFKSNKGEVVISNWDDMLQFFDDLEPEYWSDSAFLPQGLVKTNFALFMEQQFALGMIDVNSWVVIELKEFVCGRVINFENAIRNPFIQSFLGCDRAFQFFFNDSAFLSKIIDTVDADITIKVLTRLFHSGIARRNIFSCIPVLSKALKKLPDYNASQVFDEFLAGFAAWRVFNEQEIQAGRSLEFINQDFCREMLVDLMREMPANYGMALMAEVVECEITWQRVREARRGVAFLLGKSYGVYDDIIIDKLFQDNAAEWWDYLRREDMVPQYAHDATYVAPMAKFCAFLMAINSRQRKRVMEELNQCGVALSAMAATYGALSHMVEYFVDEGNDPSILPEGHDKDALAYFMQARNNRNLTANECNIVVKLLENGCRSSAKDIDFESHVEYCARVKPDNIPKLLALGVSIKDPLKIMEVLIANDTLTFDIYKSMLCHSHFHALIGYPLPKKYEKYVSSLSVLMHFGGVKLSITETKNRLYPTTEVVTFGPVLSRNTFFSLCLMYAVGGVKYSPADVCSLAVFSKDILILIASFCTPMFDLKEARQLLNACSEQAVKLKALRASSVPVCVMQSTNPFTKKSDFNFFLPAAKLADKYIALKKSKCPESKLNAFRETAAPHIVANLRLYKNPGRNIALANRLVDVELCADMLKGSITKRTL